MAEAATMLRAMLEKLLVREVVREPTPAELDRMLRMRAYDNLAQRIDNKPNTCQPHMLRDAINILEWARAVRRPGEGLTEEACEQDCHIAEYLAQAVIVRQKIETDDINGATRVFNALQDDHNRKAADSLVKNARWLASFTESLLNDGEDRMRKSAGEWQKAFNKAFKDSGSGLPVWP